MSFCLVKSTNNKKIIAAFLHEQGIFGIDNHGFYTVLALSNPGRSMIMATKAKKTAKSSTKARSAAKKSKSTIAKSTKASAKNNKKSKVEAKKKKPQVKKVAAKVTKGSAKAKVTKAVKAKKVAVPSKKKAPVVKSKAAPVAKVKAVKPVQLKVVANEKAKPPISKKPAIAPKIVASKKVAVKEERVRIRAEIKEPINVLDVYNIIPLQITPGDEPVYDTQLSNMGISPYQEQAGEEYMNEKQHEHFRKILGIWKRQLLEEMGRTVHHLQDEAANFPDPNDRATQEEEFSLELRARDRERKLIKKIEETLQKIEEGDYGFCDSCGVEIGIRRLEARPTANLCIDCKTLDEIRERQLGG